MKIMRQGDVAFILNGKCKPSTEVIEKKDKIVAHGEVTGHAHRITKGDALLFVDKALKEAMEMATTMQIKAKTPCALTHEEHGPLHFPVGEHPGVTQREFDWATKLARKVVD